MRTVGREVPRSEQDGPWKVLAPFAARPAKRPPKKPDTNGASIVMNVEGWLLLTGDLPKKVEKRLLARGLDPVQVLKVGHHGSSTSTGTDFVRALEPELALISCGRRNTYGHPNAKALASLDGVLLSRTDLEGCLALERRADGSVSLRPWLDAEEEALRRPRARPLSPWRALEKVKRQAWVEERSADETGDAQEP